MRPFSAGIAAALVWCATSAHAQDLPPTEPPPEAAPLPPSAPPPADSPAPPAEVDQPAGETAVRKQGVRLALGLGFARANDAKHDNTLTTASPSVLPIEIEVAWRQQPRLLLGFHGHAGLASRTDCGSLDHCSAKSYGLGGHIELPFQTTPATVLGWARFGIGWEMLWQSGIFGDSGGRFVKQAIDMLDARIGADIAVARLDEGRAVRIGPYAGFIAGTTISSSGRYKNGTTEAEPTKATGGFVWLTAGLRGTFDP